MIEQLEEIIGHLGAALNQQAPSDDKIIMGHIREAHAAAKSLLDDILYGAKNALRGL